MKIKKHKIKVFSEEQESGFVLDLRPKIEKKNEKQKNSKFKNNLFTGFSKNINKEIKEPRAKRKFKFKNLFIFKLFLAIILFFWDWAKDIFKFFLKIKKKKNNLALPVRRIKTSFNFKLEDVIKISKKKALLLFILLLFLLIVPFKIFSYFQLASDYKFKKDLLDHSFSGLESFMFASEDIINLNLDSAQQNFINAGDNFIYINQELRKVDELVVFLSAFSSNKEIKMLSELKRMIKTAIHLSSAGDNLSLAMSSLLHNFSDDSKKAFSDFSYYSNKIKNDFKKANSYLQKIKISSLPQEYQAQFQDLKDQANLLEKNLFNFLKIVPALREFLAVDMDKRYLVVFQNNAEMRASGGFIGSYALLDLSKGKIKNIEVPAGGSYDTEGGLRVLVEAPHPLHLVDPLWNFWNANWWPDWEMSAQSLMYFYERSGGPSVDGVIALSPEILEDILKIVGPIDLSEKYGVIIDYQNFREITQEIVEVIGQPELYKNKDLQTDILTKVILPEEELSSSSDIFLRNEPKKIIGDLMSEIFKIYSENLDQSLVLSSLKILEQNLNEKNILLYFNDKKLQKEVENFSWAGKIKEAPLDYLMIVNSNIAGGKTDLVIKNNYSLNVEVMEDASLVNTLTIKRDHQGFKSNLFSGIRNVNWLRVYVPLASQLISAKGFLTPDEKYFKESQSYYEKDKNLERYENRAEIDLTSGLRIYQELDKTVFANWTMTDPQNFSLIEIKYKTPFNFKDQKKLNYSLLWQKQASSGNIDFDFSLTNNLDLKPSWTYPAESILSDGSIGFSSNLITDKYTAIILE